ncbi:hypothetical protein L21TH_0845 [Caldisalinibacter kiritimatiensis]|uniref:Uncharacterized protein n=1 Tax=Caldisalinibacter kiritimatiensis TaxID=1304284 RepID=R1AWR8_9FIRM|nr:hypothetical protein L21TH_0845 [Caldisalinibacter kiritimatiensis]
MADLSFSNSSFKVTLKMFRYIVSLLSLFSIVLLPLKDKKPFLFNNSKTGTSNPNFIKLKILNLISIKSSFPFRLKMIFIYSGFINEIKIMIKNNKKISNITVLHLNKRIL